ncbi:amidohydrolase family protein [Vallitalea sp.]
MQYRKNKILYGSDWPLVDTKAYIEFVKKLLPKKYYKDVFYNNAKRVFSL